MRTQKHTSHTAKHPVNTQSCSTMTWTQSHYSIIKLNIDKHIHTPSLSAHPEMFTANNVGNLVGHLVIKWAGQGNSTVPCHSADGRLVVWVAAINCHSGHTHTQKHTHLQVSAGLSLLTGLATCLPVPLPVQPCLTTYLSLGLTLTTLPESFFAVLQLVKCIHTLFCS